jgi:hypothetical protein
LLFILSLFNLIKFNLLKFFYLILIEDPEINKQLYNLSQKYNLINKNTTTINSINNTNNNNNNTNNNYNNSLKNENEKENNLKEDFNEILKSEITQEIMLKIFSKDNLIRNLNSKFGKNFYEKLNNKKFSIEELNIIKEEIKIFSENENFKKENFNIDYIKDYLRNLSPKKYDFSNEILEKKKPFGVFAKKSNGFFDTAIQYGGESEILKNSFNSFYDKRNSKSKSKSKSLRKKLNNSNSLINSNGNLYNNNNKNDNFNFNMNYIDNEFNDNNNNNNFGVEVLRKSKDFDFGNRKLNEEFLINNEIHNELVKKPMKIV